MMQTQGEGSCGPVESRHDGRAIFSARLRELVCPEETTTYHLRIDTPQGPR